jgi:hypothetical protein
MKYLDGPMQGRELSEWWERQPSSFVSYPSHDSKGYAVEHLYRKDTDGLRFVSTKLSQHFDSAGNEVPPVPVYPVFVE